MTQIVFPTVNVPIISAATQVENTAQKMLFVGPSTGATTAGTLHENIAMTPAEINTKFGEGSPLANMLIAGREINKDVQFDALEVVTGDGVAAVATIVFGAAASDETYTIVIGSKDKGKVVTSVTSGTSASDTVDAIVLNITNNYAHLGITAANNPSGTLELTTNENLTAFNNAELSVLVTDSANLPTVNKFASGADGTITSAMFDAIGENRYQTVVWPFSSDVSIVSDFLDGRFNVTDDVLDGVSIFTSTDTFSNISTALTSINSSSLVYMANEEATDNGNSLSTGNYNSIAEFPWIISSKVGAIRSLRLQDGANIASIVISSNGALDAIGGAALASKPYANTPVTGLETVESGLGFTKAEVTSLNNSGASVLGNNKAKNAVIMGQMLTTYKTDSAGNSDISFKYLNYVDSASVAREFFFNNLSSRYAQSRLTDGNLIKGRDMTNETEIRATMVGYYQTLSGVDYVVGRSGEDALNFFKNNLIISVDLATGQVDMAFQFPLVTQLRKINAPMQLKFNLD